MNNELLKSTIKSLLEKEGHQEAKGEVHSITFNKDMSLVGFIPYYNKRPVNINMNSDIIVASNFVCFKGGSYHHVMDSVTSCTTLLNNDNEFEYKVENKCKVLAISTAVEYDDINKYNTYKDSSIATKIIKRATKDPSCNCHKGEDGYIYYKPNKDDKEFTYRYSNDKIIANSFLCLCAYINEKTGKPNYAVFRDDDLVRTLSNPFSI